MDLPESPDSLGNLDSPEARASLDLRGSLGRLANPETLGRPDPPDSLGPLGSRDNVGFARVTAPQRECSLKMAQSKWRKAEKCQWRRGSADQILIITLCLSINSSAD